MSRGESDSSLALRILNMSRETASHLTDEYVPDGKLGGDVNRLRQSPHLKGSGKHTGLVHITARF